MTTLETVDVSSLTLAHRKVWKIRLMRKRSVSISTSCIELPSRVAHAAALADGAIARPCQRPTCTPHVAIRLTRIQPRLVVDERLAPRPCPNIVSYSGGVA